MRRINIVLWGIGQHSVKKILPAITNCKSLNLYGLFSRNKKVLNKNKKKFKCKIWPNPDQMLKDSNIDVVYLSTPIGLHFEQAKKILSFNKHIWIEKSLARNYKEVSQLIALAKRKKKAICEAFMYSYHPQFIYLKDMLNKKSIGNIKKVEIYFGFPHLKRNNWRYNNKLGGAILDNGCYPVSAILKLFSNQIKIIYKNININRKLWIDTLRDLEIPFGESQGAYYICFDISKFKKSSKEVSQELREKHKLIINSQDENYLRASFMADKDTLEIGLNKLSEYFRNI